MLSLQIENRIVKIEAGELVSFKQDHHEFIHQKGSPGWGSSDTEMFPVIGPVNENDFKVDTPEGTALLDQHGHLRRLKYELIDQTTTTATYRKTYKANTPIKNTKYPANSSLEFMQWPYSFEFEKSFSLTEKGLEIVFKINSDTDMPFMLGYHPAFKIYTDNPTLKSKNKETNLNEVLAVGSRALQVPNCNSITLNDKKSITISTEGFGHFMCWTEVDTMLCIEPISFYPYEVLQQDLHRGFQTIKENRIFKVLISPHS